MTRDRSAVWIGTVDLCLAVLAVVIVAVNPKIPPASGAPQQAEHLVSMDWDVEHYDADMDLWVVTPSGKPVFFGNRQVGCVTLDQDNKGWIDSVITMSDGSQSTIKRAKETIAIRCQQPGHYVVGGNVYSYHDHEGTPRDHNHIGMPVHFEIDNLNPTMKIVFDKTVTFDRETETINITAFDIDKDGQVTISDPPLAPVTDSRNNK